MIHALNSAMTRKIVFGGTFDSVDSHCSLLSTCDSLETDLCPECVSGGEYCPTGRMPECNACNKINRFYLEYISPPPSGQVLIVSGGSNHGNDLSSVEAVALGMGNVSCALLPDLPHVIYWGGSYKMPDGNPVVCDDGEGYECYQLVNAGSTYEWETVATMTNQTRYGYGYAQVNEDWWAMGKN